MIRYSLACDQDHRFEGWFQSAAAFDRLAGAGMVACAICGSIKVEKALMAPSVAATGATGAEGRERSTGAEGPLSTPATPLEEALAEMRRRIESESDYVGLSFAAEARAMHEGRSPERAIWGEAKPDEARALIEDGVPVAPLPFRPRSRQN
ncbi:MAG: DUF1178 family protein [Rubellimicrobium sp.]|nr:DUF1178 family protein [Rubellimicrobium sp.]